MRSTCVRRKLTLALITVTEVSSCTVSSPTSSIIMGVHSPCVCVCDGVERSGVVPLSVR